MRLFVLLLTLLVPMLLPAQDESSLADAAKKTREGNKPRSKIVITEETIKAQRGPIPDIEFDGEQNDAFIVNAIRDYRATHTPAETENTLREWFIYYDNMQLRLIRENNQMMARRQDPNLYDPERYGRDYQQAVQKARHDAQSEILDLKISQKNSMMAGRIQGTLYAVKNGIAKLGMKYDWLKVHYGNGIQTYD
jgi:hypothetical protein